MGPGLLLVAHGSADPRAAGTVNGLARRIGALRPGLAVAAGFLEHAGPRPAAALDGLPPGPVVVAPLLLAEAYHATVDVQEVVEAIGATGRRAVRAGVLGPDPELAGIGQQLLLAAGVPAGAAVVLASAGTSREEANAATRAQAASLAALRGTAVQAAFASAAEPDVPRAIAELAGRGAPVAVLRWLLSPGRFADQVAEAARAAGAACTGLLGEHPALPRLVLARYDEAAGMLGPPDRTARDGGRAGGAGRGSAGGGAHRRPGR